MLAQVVLTQLVLAQVVLAQVVLTKAVLAPVVLAQVVLAFIRGYRRSCRLLLSSSIFRRHVRCESQRRGALHKASAKKEESLSQLLSLGGDTTGFDSVAPPCRFRPPAHFSPLGPGARFRVQCPRHDQEPTL